MACEAHCAKIKQHLWDPFPKILCRKFHTRGIKVVSKLSNLEFGSLESHKVWPFQHEMCRNRVKNCSWIQSSKISHMILQIWDISGWLKELIINYIYCKFFNVWWKLDFLFFFLLGEMREQPINYRRSNVFPAFSDKKKGGAGLSWHFVWKSRLRRRI